MPTHADPPFLGFECRRALRDELSRYDWFCFLEDDIIVTDPGLLDKVRWFTERHGEHCVLMPNRYEMRAVSVEPSAPAEVCIDMEFAPGMPAPYQHLAETPEVVDEHLGGRVVFRLLHYDDGWSRRLLTFAKKAGVRL